MQARSAEAGGQRGSRRTSLGRRAGFLLCLAAVACLVSPALGGTAVRLQLKWRHQFQFAGYYAALEQGYYRAADLDVTILPARPGTNAVDEVLSGRAEFGVASSELVLRYAKGDPVIALAAVFQHSPLTLLARRDSGIETVHDLVGKRVALSPSEAELFAYLRREKVPVERLQVVEHDFSVKSLIDGKVDALAGYETDEPYSLQGSMEHYLRLSPRSSGIDFYGDTLFTTRAEVESAPQLVEKFRDASLRGWKYALEHPEEMSLFIHKHHASDLPVAKLRFEAAQLIPLVRSDLVEIGHHHVGRWEHILGVYRELGMLPDEKAVDIAGLLFQRPDEVDYRWLLWVVLGSGLVVAAVGWMAGRFYRLSRSLRHQLEENLQLEEQLRRLAIRDPLTNLYNRRYLEETLVREMARARREGSGLSVIILDVDDFKQVNDVDGHAAGDAILQALGALLVEHTRACDIACRYGGDEFLVVLPGAELGVARERAEFMRRVFRELKPVQAGKRSQQSCSLSLGVAALRPDDAGVESVITRADQALYEAKQGGRDRVAVIE